MSYRGDKRDQFPEGTRLGPDAHGLMHEVTQVTYDEATDRTTIATRKLEIENGTVRFTGGRE